VTWKHLLIYFRIRFFECGVLVNKKQREQVQ
jgi:hypothetical protein